VVGFLLLFPFGRIFPQVDPAGPSLPHLDKVVHLALFLVLGVLVGRSLLARRITRAALSSFFWVAGYGGVLELLQGWIPGRHMSVADAAFNVLGSLVAALWLTRRESGR